MLGINKDEKATLINKIAMYINTGRCNDEKWNFLCKKLDFITVKIIKADAKMPNVLVVAKGIAKIKIAKKIKYILSKLSMINEFNFNFSLTKEPNRVNKL